MDHYKEINSAKEIFITEILEPRENEFRFTLTIGQVSEVAEDIFISGTKLAPVRKIGTTDSSPQFTIHFNSYISYSVINESFESFIAGEFEGNKVRVYTDSNFLKYISTETFATKDYPGKYKHYCFISHNHIINVASVNEPEIVKIEIA